jgi:hypothetical protein
MSDTCQNKNALYIDWAKGDVYPAQCLNEATKIVVTGVGFESLCDECAKDRIEKFYYPRDLGD